MISDSSVLGKRIMAWSKLACGTVEYDPLNHHRLVTNVTVKSAFIIMHYI